MSTTGDGPVLGPANAEQKEHALQALRQALVQPELKRFEPLLSRPIGPADVANVLVPAVDVVGEAGRHPQLARAFRDIVIEANRLSGEEELQRASMALSPIIMPAISRAISESMDQMNRTVQSASPINRLKWQAESKRTGVPIEQLIARDSYRYHITHLLVIGVPSGEIIRKRLGAPSVPLNASHGSLITSMIGSLTQIAKQGFDAVPELAVQRVNFGTSEAIVSRSGSFICAALVDGKAPPLANDQIRELMQAVGDEVSKPQLKYDQVLDRCLDSFFGFYRNQKKSSGVGRYVLTGIGLLCALAFGSWAFKNAEARRLEQWLLAQPGVQWAQVAADGGRFDTRVIADPMIELQKIAPTAVLIQPDRIRWNIQSALSLEPSLVEARVRQALALPEGVVARVDAERKLVVTGTATPETIETVRRFPYTAFGVKGVDVTGLTVLAPAVAPSLTVPAGVLPEALLKPAK